ncbi:hypothetical protein PROFUN_01558 [Planoprotostelium fungivorum]|uniref:Uncharacterized protein n=1 Tax=Planoprotostelium fungivorum TaxID=1890364 RepID=A0A2P6NTN4_9EUKA|nr:hypothetical protein PROFUN_01558 [Planoprotostelium fungivorum]
MTRKCLLSSDSKKITGVVRPFAFKKDKNPSIHIIWWLCHHLSLFSSKNEKLCIRKLSLESSAITNSATDAVVHAFINCYCFMTTSSVSNKS